MWLVAGLKLLERFTSSRRNALSVALRQVNAIPSGTAGYVAQFEIIGHSTVVVGEVRHQREDDYH